MERQHWCGLVVSGQVRSGSRDFEKIMKSAARIMKRYWNALRELART
jgi:hypothetical protein